MLWKYCSCLLMLLMNLIVKCYSNMNKAVIKWKSKKHVCVSMSTFVAVDVAETGETFPTFTPADVLPFFLYSNRLVVFRSFCACVWVTCFCVIPVVGCAVVRTERAGTLQTVTRPWNHCSRSSTCTTQIWLVISDQYSIHIHTVPLFHTGL